MEKESSKWQIKKGRKNNSRKRKNSLIGTLTAKLLKKKGLVSNQKLPISRIKNLKRRNREKVKPRSKERSKEKNKSRKLKWNKKFLNRRIMTFYQELKKKWHNNLKQSLQLRLLRRITMLRVFYNKNNNLKLFECPIRELGWINLKRKRWYWIQMSKNLLMNKIRTIQI